MSICVSFNLCLQTINNLMFQYIIGPFLLIVIFIIIGYLLLVYRNRRAIAARGGIRTMYPELFEAISIMPDNKILSENTTSFIATYLNDSKRHCKIEVTVTKSSTFVTLWLLYKDRWVKTSKQRYSGSFDGEEILWKIILDFPESDLPDNKTSSQLPPKLAKAD